jgi:hypothetical protein
MIRQTGKRLGSVLGVGRVTPRVLVDQSARSQAVNRVIVHNQDFRTWPTVLEPEEHSAWTATCALMKSTH